MAQSNIMRSTFTPSELQTPTSTAVDLDDKYSPTLLEQRQADLETETIETFCSLNRADVMAVHLRRVSLTVALIGTIKGTSRNVMRDVP
jgi:hypothetical protein